MIQVRKNFLFRLLVAHLVIPAVPALLLLLTVRGSGGGGFSGFPWLFVTYYLFGLAAMLCLGAPMLLLSTRLGWTGFLPFTLGAGVCAAATAYPFAGLATAGLFAIFGVVSGAGYRILLFGWKQQACEHPLPTRHLRIAGRIVSLLFASAFLFFLASNWDQHRTVTEQMGWQCISPDGPSQSVRLWFRKNPHYEERAAGPHLCADLEAAASPDISMSFDVWGNGIKGLHGHNQKAIFIGPRRLDTDLIESAGFHDDTVHYGNYTSREHPEINRFPLEVFR